jgi:hypothetical protein
MKGLDLSRHFFENHGEAFRNDDLLPFASIGLVGNGSECFGFDDELSQDHDFEPGFCVWVDDDAPDEVFQALTDAYECLPSSYLGYQRSSKAVDGQKRRGVFRTAAFYRNIIGLPRAPQTISEWLSFPDYALAAATNGELFTDHATDFSYIRNSLLNGMPRDIRLKRIAKHMALMAQSGQYNFARCLKHGEVAASRLALSEFAIHTASVAYHLNNRYPPFYKWILRGVRDLPQHSDLSIALSELLLLVDDNDILRRVENISSLILTALKEQGLTNGNESYLEIHAYRIMERIQNNDIRSLHVMA